MRKATEGEKSEDERSIGKTAARVLHLLIHGEYRNSAGKMVPVKGDISKLFLVHGLSARDLAMVRNSLTPEID